MHQLELYELCDCNPDPATSPEYRRFLMNYTAQDVLGAYCVSFGNSF